ncbi:MAG TPA: trypsin-like peptidase domain-containing protein [Flavobacteriales bacterium]|jgi:lysyl endopeptidase|nr:trypsin-like peptidase domain-containing protein [Flavobacteriales bacterium]MBK7112434.1 trypsin-like peptidase domain-containing protein [Flavobacteriales bacterium]MBK7481562.1 trypsin-like peptidase domain-containing protein [Flavobacteriales bacterium]MBK7620320.1 trypsin-like peptidase domain-containing protein [Flavobacteriales bacterium]MBK8530433.1 trypsin-like peptidase domain-containing protein [Flavobacteriales bacterium]
MSIRAVAFLATFLLLSASAHAQLSFGGHPLGMDRSLALPEAPVAVMPPIDQAAIDARDAATRASGAKGPFWYGYNHTTDLSLENSGVWHTMSNGDRVWRLAIECPGAYSINLQFLDYIIPDGAQVFVYNNEDVLGGFEANSNPGHTELGVDLLAGDRVTVEYVEPARVAGQGRLQIGQVTHGYKDVLGTTRGLGDSGSCNNNVICPIGDPWRDQIRSVAIVLTQGGLCTGQLLNNCNNDGTPYFLTANHCLDNSTNWVFRFNWNSPSCPNNLNAPYQSLSGYTLLENSGGSDVALLELNTTPPVNYNVFYSGWDRSTSPASSATGIHHPSGDVKKISLEEQAVVSSTYGSAQTWRVPGWDDGTTEAGSSGSGLWNQDGSLVGQLYGGDASCEYNFNDHYGKFSVSFPLLSEWLGSCGTQLQGYPASGVGIQDEVVADRVQILPNPTAGLVTILLPQGLVQSDLRVIDAVGRTVVQHTIGQGTERLSLDLTGQGAGAYAVEVTTNGSRIVERLVITR